MQIRTPRAQLRDTDFGIRLNGGRGEPFATIELDENYETEIVVESLGDCDRLLRAAAAAKALLIEHADDKDKPHKYRAPAGKPCLVCGKSENEPLHAGPAIEGTVVKRGEHPYPVPCRATTLIKDGMGGTTAYCTREAGHGGLHHDGPAAEWGDEPAVCGARPYPAGSEGDDGTQCVLPAHGDDVPHDDGVPIDPGQPAEIACTRCDAAPAVHFLKDGSFCDDCDTDAERSHA